MWSHLTLGPSFKVKRWFIGCGVFSFQWIQFCIGSLMCWVKLFTAGQSLGLGDYEMPSMRVFGVCVCVMYEFVMFLHKPLYLILLSRSHNDTQFFTLQPLGAVRVLFSPMVSGWVVVQAGAGKKLVWPVSQKP